MKKILMLSALLSMFAAPAAFAEGYDYGLSPQAATPLNAKNNVTETLLDKQRQRGGASTSEISAQTYVDTQRRLSESFTQPMPETLQEKASSTTSTNR